MTFKHSINFVTNYMHQTWGTLKSEKLFTVCIFLLWIIMFLYEKLCSGTKYANQSPLSPELTAVGFYILYPGRQKWTKSEENIKACPFKISRLLCGLLSLSSLSFTLHFSAPSWELKWHNELRWNFLSFCWGLSSRTQTVWNSQQLQLVDPFDGSDGGVWGSDSMTKQYHQIFFKGYPDNDCVFMSLPLSLISYILRILCLFYCFLLFF